MFRKGGIQFIYCVVFLFAFDRCAYNDLSVTFDCDKSTLEIALLIKQDASGCKSIDGSISVTASGGAEPYDFSINGGEYQTNNQFTDLGSGTYMIRVKDMNSCWKSIEVSIGSLQSDLSASATTTTDNQCSTDNGTATVTATGGTPPYEYQIDAKGFGTGNSFAGLKNGPHTVMVKDSEGCQTTLGVVVIRGNTGISFANSIKGILDTNCSGCHGAGSGSLDWTNFTNVKSHAGNIKTRTANGSMPPGAPLPQNQIDLIGCWVDDGALNN